MVIEMGFEVNEMKYQSQPTEFTLLRSKRPPITLFEINNVYLTVRQNSPTGN